MTTDEKIELGVLGVIIVVLLFLWGRNTILGIPTSLNLPGITLGASPTVAGVNVSPLGIPPLADPAALPFTGQYSCMCQT